MRIFIACPGHLRTVPMGRYCVETLRQLGHETQWFDAGTLRPIEKLVLRPWAKLRGKHALEKTRLNQRLQEAVTSFRPDLFLAIFGFDIFPETIQEFRRNGIRTACWWLNDPFQFQRGLNIAQPYDFFFSNCSVSTEKYRRQGISNAHYLPHAAFETVHRPRNLSDEEKKRFACEVCFVGDWGPVRQGILSQLSQRVDLKIWGPWRKHLTPKDRLWSRIVDGYFTPADMVGVFNTCKVSINLHSWYGYFDYGLNPRTFETNACRTVQICDWKQELDQHFEIDREILTFRQGEELEQKIQSLLQDSSARTQIAEAGYQRILKEHTYPHRMKQMLGYVFGE